MKLFACLALVVAVWPTGADAQSLSFSAGQVGVVDDLKEPQWYGIEYRGRPLSRWNVVPGVGYHQAACGASYVYATFVKTIRLSDDWALTPFFGPGFWADSEQIQLGHTIQFRSGIDLVYRVSDGVAVGLGITHLSNGSLGSLNPGTETVAISLTMPI